MLGGGFEQKGAGKRKGEGRGGKGGGKVLTGLDRI